MFSKPLIVIAEHYKVLFWMGVEVILKECCTKYCQLCDTSITLVHCSLEKLQKVLLHLWGHLNINFSHTGIN